MSDQQQKHERIEINGEVRGEVQIFQPMTITQISMGGIRVETPSPLLLDSLHTFRLELAGVSIVVKGRIVHCRISDVDPQRVTYRAGVEFIEPPEHAQAVLAEFVTKLRAAKERA